MNKVGLRAVWVAAMILASGIALRADARDCTSQTPSPGRVRAVLDGLTLALEDGRTVRLAGIDTPPAAAADLPNAAATTYLRTILAGQTLAIHPVGAGLDRYGRVAGYVFVEGASLEGPVQQAMVARGLARVASRVGERACAVALLAQERQAREARLGLWADPANAPRKADQPAAVLASRGGFALVEGQVLSARESGGTIYVNFGRRWSEDFTVTVAKRNERRLIAAGVDPKGLARRMVRVRGVVEERGGPWIEVTHPEQVEVVRP